MSDDVRVEAIPPTDPVPGLKKQMRDAIVDWRLAAASQHQVPYPGGHGIQAYLVPGFAEKARRVNALAARLKELDPEFTADWTPLPEGR